MFMKYKGYKIEHLDSDKFDELPYNDAQVALGLCDINSKKVFARNTGNPVMDLFTIAHEIDHVDNGDCGELEDPNQPGVYYKKAKSWIIPAIAAASFLIPGVGPAIGGALSSIGGAAGGALSSLGLGGITSALSPIGTALSGAGASFAGAGKSVQGALGISNLFGSGSAATNAGYASNAGRVGSSMGGGFGLGTGTGTGSAAASGGGNVLGSVMSGLGKSTAKNLVQNSLSPKAPKQDSAYPDYMDKFNSQFQNASQQQQPQQGPPATSVIGSMGDGNPYRKALRAKMKGNYVGR